MYVAPITPNTLASLFEPLLTSRETAAILRCHTKTVQRMARDGQIPCILRGKHFFFRLSELDAWVLRNSRPSRTM